MKKILVAVLVVALALIGASAVMAGTGHGTTCTTCHMPHNAGTVATLWRAQTGADGTNTLGISDAKSSLCMSCHDTIARGPGADLTNDHPLTTSVDNAKGTTAGTVAQCYTCHVVHNGVDMYIAQTCAGCHDETNSEW